MQNNNIAISTATLTIGLNNILKINNTPQMINPYAEIFIALFTNFSSLFLTQDIFVSHNNCFLL